MRAPLSVDFDYISPFAYLATELLPDLAARHDAVLDWKPTEKLGFVYERDAEHANLPHGFYRLAPRAERRPGDSS